MQQKGREPGVKFFRRHKGVGPGFGGLGLLAGVGVRQGS